MAWAVSTAGVFRVACLLTLLLASLSARAGEHDLPNRSLTPGVALAGITAEQVCRPGYAAKARDVSSATKQAVYVAYGLVGNHSGYCGGSKGCEVDHLISLELGGSNDAANLWAQSYESQPWNARRKDHLENTLHALVCSGRLSLSEAQRAIAENWIEAYRRFIGSD